VFLANTPGRWIHPETMPVEKLVAVAEQCPSGAIRYRRHDGKPDEAPPPVNLLRIRENGPYAVHAPLDIAGREDGFRATLCRFGQSKRKPYCDGSHVAAAFSASGEPATVPAEPLDAAAPLVAKVLPRPRAALAERNRRRPGLAGPAVAHAPALLAAAARSTVPPPAYFDR
jgi:CDGSH-type Zn-finger protein